MSTFIKTGYWETAKDRKKGWLDLEALILKVTGGGGGVPTLQSVLDSGSSASKPGGQIGLNEGTDSNRILYFVADNNLNTTGEQYRGISMWVSPQNTYIAQGAYVSSSPYEANGCALNIENGFITIRQNHDVNNNNFISKLIFAQPTATCTFSIPAKATNGDYTLATTDDLDKKQSTTLANTNILVGNASNVATPVVISDEATIANTGAITLTNSAVIAKQLTGFTAGAGTVGASDSILQAIQKLDGNNALKAPLASPAFTAIPTAPTAAPGTNTNQIATTAFVLANAGGGGSSPIAVVNTNSLFSVTPVAGFGATGVSNSIFLGQGTATNASGASSSNFLGQIAGQNATNASQSNFLGSGTGNGATNANNSNFLGQNAGLNASAASYSNFLGYQTGRQFSSNNVGSNNIIIGTNISLPNAATNSINIGGVLFGVNTYSNTGTAPSIVPTVDGRIGIGVVTPTATLDIAASTTLQALMRLRVGVAPTAPNDGDVWLESNTITGLKIRLGGVTRTITIT